MNLIRAVVDLLYPPRCPFCGKVLEVWEKGMCQRCQAGLPWMEGECKRVEFCQACLSPLWYQDQVRRGIHCYKFQGGREHADMFGLLMAQCLADGWREPLDAVTWVPLSRRRLRRRGYDQAKLLACRVGEELGLEVVATLEKVRETRQQSKLIAFSARTANVAGAYALQEGADMAGKRMVLVDDVATSGSTLRECAACLCMAGAEQVIALTLARAR